APDFQGCRWHDPRHDWPSVQRQFNHGKCDGWLKTAPPGDTFSIGYYTDIDLPITAALARGHTTLDRYFCSVMRDRTKPLVCVERDHRCRHVRLPWRVDRQRNPPEQPVARHLGSAARCRG